MASAGTGTAPHLVGELFRMKAVVDLVQGSMGGAKVAARDDAILDPDVSRRNELIRPLDKQLRY